MEGGKGIFKDDPQRYTVFPIRYPDLWRFYKQAVAGFWTPEEVDLSSDDWNALSEAEKRFVKNILAFFATADGIVVENLALRFSNKVGAMEARMFYHFQAAMENIHGETYGILLDHYVDDADEKAALFEAITTVPCIAKKAEWALRYISNDSSFATRLVAFACVEGIFFSASFCAIFWLKKRGMLPRLTFSNELISRDEALHTAFACHLYSKELSREKRLSGSEVVKIVKDAVDNEIEFVRGSLCDLAGMNAALMGQYVKFVADRLLVDLGHGKAYNVQTPFDWMEFISVECKTSFFESRVSSYQKAGVMKKLESNDGFADDNF
jgi:ribonucleoside-diphosphate reductase subunit M2